MSSTNSNKKEGPYGKPLLPMLHGTWHCDHDASCSIFQLQSQTLHSLHYLLTDV